MSLPMNEMFVFATTITSCLLLTQQQSRKGPQWRSAGDSPRHVEVLWRDQEGDLMTSKRPAKAKNAETFTNSH